MKRLLALAATGALMSLTGCGQAADPPAQADPTPSVSPTKAVPTAPAMPDAATQQTKAGAIAFAKYFWVVVDFAQRTGNTAVLRELQADSCQACSGGAAAIENVAKHGGHIRGGRHLILRTYLPDAATLRSKVPQAGVVLRMRVTRQRVSGAGTDDGTYASGIDVISMLLTAAGTSWEVTSWSVLP